MKNSKHNVNDEDIKENINNSAKKDDDDNENMEADNESKESSESKENKSSDEIKDGSEDDGGAENDEADFDLADSLKKQNDKLNGEITKLENENNTLKDRLARNVAEYDNYRKRTSKEKEGIYTDACEDILKAILPVLDNLERAVSVEGNVDDLKKGVEMTMKQFSTALEKLNVEEIDASGQFDPHFHNAVMHIDDENYDKNQIVEVFQKGYKRGEKVLRYSMVKVAN